MKLPLLIAHGGELLVALPVVAASALCLVVAACLKIFQDDRESPKPRRWLTAIGLAILGILPFSGAILRALDNLASR